MLMLHWLVQETTAHPDLGRGVAPSGVLSAAEQTRYRALRSEKRRRDWLLGRWTAKHLLQALLREQGGCLLPLDAIAISNDADGVPLANYPFSISISHSNGRAFCVASKRVLADGRPWPVGADMERIEARAPVFVADYFTAAEQEAVAQAAPALRETFITAVWSAKEAVLKALHLGLSVDTRTVSCLFGPVTSSPAMWRPFAIALDEARLERPAPALAGWWRLWGSFVLTVAVQQRRGPAHDADRRGCRRRL